MNKIGFKNFRKFADFPEIELGGVTILVGGNNAGKSTLVKAMLLMRDFLLLPILNRRIIPVFKFDTEHVSIGNFGRAICRNSKVNQDTISFKLGLDKYEFCVDIKGDKKSEDVQPIVSHLCITDTENNYDFIYEPDRMVARFGISGKNEARAIDLKKNKKDLELLQKELGNTKDLETITMIKDEIAKVSYALNSLNNNVEEKEEMVTMKVPDVTYGDSGLLLIPEIVATFVNYISFATRGDKRSAEYKEAEANKMILKAKAPYISMISRDIEDLLRHLSIEYIFAHSVSQQVFYNIVKDSNDYVTKVVHDFYQARISEGDEEFNFLHQWLKEFEVGDSIKVISLKGEAYQVLVIDKKNKKGIDLADKGMGSIQVAILLMRIATLMRQYKNSDLTILLEEPEQNLHPALQSKLADLLLDVHRRSEFQFIVETHSEYLVRKSQVIVANENNSLNLFENPFKCYYLPNDGKKPYEMLYRKDGNFSNEFGEGFFDTATKLLYDIL